MRKFILIFLLALFPLVMSGQDRREFDRFKERTERRFDRSEERKNDRFERFSDKVHARFERFRAKANYDYAAFMAKTWGRYSALPPMKRPTEPKPVVPPVYVPDDDIDVPVPDYTVPYEEIEVDTTPVAPPELLPVPVSPEPMDIVTFSFYGTECHAEADMDFRFTLGDLSEAALGPLWIEISDGRFNNMLSDCIKARSDLALCDWAYLKYVEMMTEAYLGTADANATVFLQHYILTQSGYAVRLCRSQENGRLALLAAFDSSDIYGYRFMRIGSENFYIVDRTMPDGSYYVLDIPFEAECVMSSSVSMPVLENRPSRPRLLASKTYPDVSADVDVNLNMMDFFGDYPLTSDWSLYSAASLSRQAKSCLYPVLKQAVSGKSEKEAVGLLLNFVQTSLEYMTDEEQFGYERPLFPDESLYYPYCDCEDRAILFSVLVREILGLDVVFLHYPGHLATAVAFSSEDVSGDNLIVDGRKFVVCDPTYINAGIGMSMPQYRGVGVKVIRTL